MFPLWKGRRWVHSKRDPRGGSSNSACSRTGCQSSLGLLPVELIEKILKHLIGGRNNRDVVKDIFSVALTCRRLQSILSQQVLYETVVVFTKRQAIKLLKCLQKSKTPTASYIKTFCYVHPVDDTSATVLLGHAGYSLSSLGADSRLKRPCPDLILDLLAMMCNLENLYLDEIAPGFRFPASLKHSKVVQEINVRTPASVQLVPEFGWRLVLNPDILWAFGCLDTLHLSNTQIDDDSIPSGPNSSSSTACKLILSGCKIRCSPSRLKNYFSNVRELVLDNLKSSSEVSLAFEFTEQLDDLTLGLVGRRTLKSPKSQELYPAMALLPAAASRRQFQAVRFYTPNEHYQGPAKDGRIDLSDLHTILTNLSKMHLKKLTLALPDYCLLPRQHQDYDSKTSILEHIGLVVTQFPVTLLVSAATPRTVTVPDVTIEYAW